MAECTYFHYSHHDHGRPTLPTITRSHQQIKWRQNLKDELQQNIRSCIFRNVKNRKENTQLKNIEHWRKWTWKEIRERTFSLCIMPTKQPYAINDTRRPSPNRNGGKNLKDTSLSGILGDTFLKKWKGARKKIYIDRTSNIEENRHRRILGNYVPSAFPSWRPHSHWAISTTNDHNQTKMAAKIWRQKRRNSAQKSRKKWSKLEMQLQ